MKNCFTRKPTFVQRKLFAKRCNRVKEKMLILGMDPWVIQPRERARYKEQFDSLKPINGVVTGEQAKQFLMKSQLPLPILGQIWYQRVVIVHLFLLYALSL